MKKQKTVSQLKDDLKPILSRFIRLRDCLRTTGSPDYGECITCDGHFRYDQLDAGHFMSRSYNATLYDERNVHAQCKGCNAFKNGDVLEYRRQINLLYGEGVAEEIEYRAKHTTKKFTPQELEQLKKELTEKISKLRNEI